MQNPFGIEGPFEREPRHRPHYHFVAAYVVSVIMSALCLRYVFDWIIP